ncbi:MAG TPA: HIT domain-containing protein [Acidimicrobiales bacterium]|jgi:ATP adenylyltransferase
MTLDHLWAGWRGEYIASARPDAVDGEACVFCRILASGEPDETTHVLWRGERTFALLNAYPYTSGHLMVMPLRHVGALEALDDDEADELFRGVRRAAAAINVAYRPGGLNVGANLGAAAGAGVPGHLHVHVLPRWAGDTNFMTSVAETRVLPETLEQTWRKLSAAL